MSYRCIAGLAVAAFVCLAQAAPRTIEMTVGQQRTWAQPRDITRAATADNEIVGVNVVAPRGVILTAKKPGSAMVSIWDAADSAEPSVQYQIQVRPATGLKPGSLLQHGKDVQVDAAGAKLRLSGALSSLEQHDALTRTLKAPDDKDGNALIDASRSEFDVQVRIDIKIVEVSRSRLQAAGFYHDRMSPNGQARGLGGPGSLSAFTEENGARTATSANGRIPFADAFNFFRWGPNSLSVFSALEANGFAYTLAEPSLTALSGQTATFLAGGEIPIPLRTGSGSDSSISVDYKEFGIRLGLTPTVLDGQRIALRIAPEVSELDENLSVTLGGFNIPGLRVRRTETTVAMADGETFVLSGLVSRQTSSGVDKFPILGDIPIIGAFFRSSRFNRDDKELIMLATPRLVRPFAKDAPLPPLPGEEVRHYDPGYLRFLLQESGHFNAAGSGFSQ